MGTASLDDIASVQQPQAQPQADPTQQATPAQGGTASMDDIAQIHPMPAASAKAPGKNSYDFLGDIIKGGGEEVGSIAKNLAINTGVVGAGRTLYDEMVNQLPPVFKAYETARNNGASLTDAMSASNDEAKRQQDARNIFIQRTKEFAANPNKATGKTIVDLLGVLAGGAFGGEAAVGSEAGGLEGAAADVSTAPAADAAAPAAEAPAAASPAAPVAPADAVATTNAAKAPIDAGTDAVTEPPTTSSVQPQIQQGLRDTVNQVASDEGLQSVPDETSVRDLGKGLGDQFYARSKATFQKVQDVTGVDLNDLSDKIATLSDKIADNVDNPEKAGQLEQQRDGLENTAGDAFKKAQDAGIDVDQAKTDWKKYNASYDFGKQVRFSTDGRSGIGSGEVVDPVKLGPRLQKMADSNSPTQPGRLQQFMGDENTKGLLNKIESTRGAIKDFEPTSATGQKALQQLIRNNTGTGKVAAIKQSLGFSPKTDWLGSYSDFNKMAPEEQLAQFGKDAPATRAFLRSNAKWQVVKMLAKGVTVEEIARTTGLSGFLLHSLL